MSTYKTEVVVNSVMERIVVGIRAAKAAVTTNARAVSATLGATITASVTENHKSSYVLTRCSLQNKNGMSSCGDLTKSRNLSTPCSQHAVVFLRDLLTDERFLTDFFTYFSPLERCALAQVCSRWRDVLYQPHYWHGVLPVLRYREIRGQKAETRRRIYDSLYRRAFDTICLYGADDGDIYDLVSSYEGAASLTRHLILRWASVTDKGLETLVSSMHSLYQLELESCNDISETGLWTALCPQLISLTIFDCINIADDSVAAITHILPSLYELNLQAYHVTDCALAYFGGRQSTSLHILRLQHCWEITNHGLLNVGRALPNLSELSVAGCTKISDAGVQLLAENLRHLRVLDLAWCSRITDVALQVIACDLGQLQELTLDRCINISDVGVGYIATMPSLTALFLRWCTQLRDFGLHHISSMGNLHTLSVVVV